MGISSVTSEALQLKLRQLLPSQQGFGTDLSASDTIIPIIDLTRAAEGSDVPAFLQRALAHGNQTTFRASNGTAVIQNTAGFWQISGVSSCNQALTLVNQISITDGVTPKLVWAHECAGANGNHAVEINLVVFLDAGDSVSAISSNPNAVMSGSSRQLADINGVLVNPVGFNPQ
tara:strand:+ start:231 stop:752 length:522 start_codon:yes stop_codon:yes gene_type:complete